MFQLIISMMDVQMEVNPFCACVRRDISSPNKGKFDDDDDDDNDDE